MARQAAATTVSRSASTVGRGPGRATVAAPRRLDPVAEAGRQDLLQLGQRPQRRLLDAGHGPVGGGAQADRHGHGLVVVEQQRR